LPVGKPRTHALGDRDRRVRERAARYWPLERIEVREEPAKSATADLVRDREGATAAKIPAGAAIVCCDPGGKRNGLGAFSTWLQGQR